MNALRVSRKLGETEKQIGLMNLNPELSKDKQIKDFCFSYGIDPSKETILVEEVKDPVDLDYDYYRFDSNSERKTYAEYFRSIADGYLEDAPGFVAELDNGKYSDKTIIEALERCYDVRDLANGNLESYRRSCKWNNEYEQKIKSLEEQVTALTKMNVDKELKIMNLQHGISNKIMANGKEIFTY